MQIYQPCIDSRDRVIWYGGESTQLHFQLELEGYDDEAEWIDEYTRTPMDFPTSMSELHEAMVDLYNYCSAGLHNF
jgi:hypothetical protein